MSCASSRSSTSSLLDNVEKLKCENLEKFRELVISHLSIYLDLDGEALEELIDDDEEPVTQPSTPFTTFRKRKKPKVPSVSERFFGSALSQKHIDILLPLIEYLSLHENLKQEGIFRKNGNMERQRQLRGKLEKHEEICYTTSPYTVHDCAGILKAFIGEMTDSLLTSRHFNSYTQIAAMKDEIKQLKALQLLLQLIPSENLALLQLLIQLLTAVAAEPSNLMNENNLAIVFAMHVIVPKRLTVDEQMKATQLLTPVFALMIRLGSQLFSYPTQLLLDVTQYLVKAGAAPGSAASSRRISAAGGRTSCTPSKSKSSRKLSFTNTKLKKKASHDDDDDDKDDGDDDEIVISSSVVFADRVASSVAAETNNTMTAVAELCAHIANMPESAQKKHLINKMQRTYSNVYIQSADGKHSFSKSIKELFSSRKRRCPPMTGVKVTQTSLHNDPRDPRISQSCVRACSSTTSATPHVDRTSRGMRPCATRLFAEELVIETKRNDEDDPGCKHDDDDDDILPLSYDDDDGDVTPEGLSDLPESSDEEDGHLDHYSESDKENDTDMPACGHPEGQPAGFTTPVSDRMKCDNITTDMRKLKGYISPLNYINGAKLEMKLERTPS